MYFHKERDFVLQAFPFVFSETVISQLYMFLNLCLNV